MPSLEEAVANWKDERGRCLVFAQNARSIGDLDRLVVRLDTAVRDVAIAVLAECPHVHSWRDESPKHKGDCPTCAMKAAINAALGIPPASGEGEGR